MLLICIAVMIHCMVRGDRPGIGSRLPGSSDPATVSRLFQAPGCKHDSHHQPPSRPHEDARFEKLGSHLRKGHLVAFPTETVWVASRSDRATL